MQPILLIEGGEYGLIIPLNRITSSTTTLLLRHSEQTLLA